MIEGGIVVPLPETHEEHWNRRVVVHVESAGGSPPHEAHVTLRPVFFWYLKEGDYFQEVEKYYERGSEFKMKVGKGCETVKDNKKMFEILKARSDNGTASSR